MVGSCGDKKSNSYYIIGDRVNCFASFPFFGWFARH